MDSNAVELSPGGPVVALNIPLGQWHMVRSQESGTVITEVKDGTAFAVPMLFPEGEVDICITLSPGGVGGGCISDRNRYLCNN